MESLYNHLFLFFYKVASVLIFERPQFFIIVNHFLSRLFGLVCLAKILAMGDLPTGNGGWEKTIVKIEIVNRISS